MNQNNQDKELLLDLTKHLEYALLELWELEKDKISSEEYDNKYGYLLAMAKKAYDYILSLSSDKQVPKQQAQKQELVVSEDGNTCMYNSVKYEKCYTGFYDCDGCDIVYGDVPCKLLPDCGKYIWIKAE